MKFRQKLISCLLAVCLFMSDMICVTPHTVYAAESAANSVSLEDVIAGVADPSQLNDATTKALTATPLLDNGIYYLNNKYCGDYLKINSSSPTASSGRLSSLGTSVQWQITNINNKITIQPQEDTSKYLAVPTSSTSSSTVTLVTVSNSTVPTECLWTVSIGEGGCLLQNAFNSRYLYTNGTSLFTSDTLNSSGTSTYKSRVWRISSLSYIDGKELAYNTEFHKCDLLIGYDANLKYRKSPDNAIWAQADDFVFSGYNNSVITIDSNGKITPVAVGQTSITCTHKVTDRVFTVDVRVWRVKDNLGSISQWADIESNFVGHWISVPTIYCEKLNTNSAFYFLPGLNSGISKWNTALEINISTTSSEASANITAYGGTISELEALGYSLTPVTLGTTERSYTYLGHYTYNNSVKLGARIDDAVICIQDKSGKTPADYINTCTHELGHALGFFGHASSSSAIMYAFGHTGNTLQTPEINHLKQVYD